MIEKLPVHITVVFVLTACVALFIFYKATHGSNWFLGILLVWIALQSVLGYSSFYQVTDTMPPRFALMIMPAVVVIILMFVLPAGRRFIDDLDLKLLTYYHTVRIPVEIGFYWLFLSGAIPELMTMVGRNYDILAGLTAPFIAYFGFTRQWLGKRALIAWNILALGLLLNIVINAVLSTPSPFQQFAFDQPNLALLNFPFNWLPSFMVPLAIFSHLVALTRLISSKPLQ